MMNHYFIAVTEEHLRDDQQINVVLNTVLGDADLYIGMQENQNLISKNEWKLPTALDYEIKSDLVVK